MDELWSPISNFGIPIVVSIFLLVRFEKKLEKLSEVIQKLVNQIEKINDK